MNKKSVYSSMILGLLASSVHADNKFYVGLNYTDVNIDDDTFTTISQSSDNGFRLDFGYNFNQYFSLEGNYYDLGGQSGSTIADDPINNFSYEYDATAFGLSAVGHIRFNHLFLYGKIGVMASDVDGTIDAVQNALIEEDGTDLLYGAGLGYAFNDNHSITVDFLGSEIGGSFEDIGLVSIGFKLSF